MIKMMVSESEAGQPNVERVDNYPGHETGRVQHSRACPHKDKHDLSGAFSPECITGTQNDAEGFVAAPCYIMKPLYMRTSHVGLVIATGEINGYDDSDFTATVWNPEEQKIERITYATTRGWAYPNQAVVDATPEAIEAAKAYTEGLRQARLKENAEKAALVPTKGKMVKVVKGRKVPKGTVGEVFWFGNDNFSRNGRYRNPLILGFMHELDFVKDGDRRIGIKTEDGKKFFLNAANVEVIHVTT